VQSLAPQQIREKVGDQLQALARKHFIRPSASDGADARYRFDHHLVRDTVYNGLLKRARATMHVEFVKWADQVNAESDRGQEFEAILGYHLEQAYRYLGELGPIDEAGAAIGRDASRRLARAGRRAFGKGDMHAAANLFQRAVALLAAGELARCGLQVELGEVLIEVGKFADARTVLTDAEQSATSIGDEVLEASARLLRLRIGMFSAEAADSGEQTLRAAQEAIPLFNRHGHALGLARAWRLVALVHGIAARYGESTEAMAKSIQYARQIGDERLLARNALGLSSSTLLGPTPVAEAIALSEQSIAGGLADRQAESKILCVLAQLHAMNGDFDKARQNYRHARDLLRDLGQGLIRAGTGIDVLIVESLAGDLTGAEREVMPDYEFLARAGEAYRRSTIAALLSRVLRDQGRNSEALVFSKIAEEITAPDDIESQALWRSIRAPILARAGEITEAEALARSAVELSQQSDAPQMRADVLSELAAVLQLLGRTDESLRAINAAIDIYRTKGDAVSTERAANWAAHLL
jgi:tetratricopeptide (TPR) repeat protein